MNKEDYFKYYIQGSDHYLISKDVFDELFDEMENWREESQKQKEVIDRKKYLLKEQGAELKELYSEIDKLQEENEKLKAELQLYEVLLKREHEAIYRVNDLEERIDKAIEYLEEPNRDSFDYSKAKLLEILKGDY